VKISHLELFKVPPRWLFLAAREKQSQGYKAVKMNACAELHYIDSPAKLDEVVQRVGSVRGGISETHKISGTIEAIQLVSTTKSVD
jgi:hypothetical protein